MKVWEDEIEFTNRRNIKLKKTAKTAKYGKR